MWNAYVLWELSRMWREERLREAERMRLIRACEARRRGARWAWLRHLRRRWAFSANGAGERPEASGSASPSPHSPNISWSSAGV